MSVKDAVIDTMKAAEKPLSAGEVEKLSGLSRKEIDKAFKEFERGKCHHFACTL